MAIVTQTDRPKSVRNRYVNEVVGDFFVLSRCFLDFSVGVGVFVIVLSPISSFSLMIEQFKLNGVRLNKLFKIFQHYP